jgi:hypothetical protein
MTSRKWRRSTNFKHGGIGMVCLELLALRSTQPQMYYSQIFPNYSSARRSVCKNSALARIKEKRAELKAAANA